MEKQFKMGSLFDGSGGFPLASTLCGIEPVFASEIEPFPIRVTTKRFPHMRHYGDISSIAGSELEPVDLITGGSPCQDMSVAGKRKGMSKECPKCGYKSVANEDADICPECGSEMQYTRSGLFMEQIRIIKEMREADERNGRSDQFIRPRFMLWENVVGAFSSNKGEDFRAVLEETAKVKDKTATIPRPPKGKWNTEGCIVGDGWSIAWRVLDAQFWGVPQRRRRIALVADFAGQCAGEILFKREGLSRNFTESRKEGQAASGDIAKGTDASGEHGIVSKHTFRKTAHPRNSEEGQGWEHTDVNDTLNVFDNGEVRTPTLVCEKDTEVKHCIGFEPGAATRTGGHTYDNQTGSLRANMGDNQFCVAKEEQYAVDFGRVADRIQMNATKAVTLQGLGGGSGAKTGLYCLPKDTPQVTMQVRCGNPNGGGKGALLQINKSATLSCGVPQTLFDPQKKVYGICSYGSNSMKSDNPHSGIYEADTARTLDLNGGNPACNQGGICVVEGNAPVYTIDEKMGNTYIWKEQGNTLASRDYKQPQAVCVVEGNGSRPSHRGDGYKESETMYTLNTTEQHAVAYDCRNNVPIEEKSGTLQAKSNGGQSLNYINPVAQRCGFEQKAFGKYDESGKASCLKSRDYKDATDLIVEPSYIVRRLTPIECARLQGFPDWWLDGLETEEPTGHDIAFWREVFEIHRKVVTGAKKPKTDKQIIKWLQNPYSDGAAYKLWGNGIALPCFLYVVEGIKEVLDRTSNE